MWFESHTNERITLAKWEINVLYAFKLGYNAAEAAQNICWAKGENAVDQSTVTRSVKKFLSGCQDLDDQAR